MSTSKNLQLISNLLQADVFIDCKTRDPDAAIVVAEAKPANRNSLYKDSVVGQLAYRSNEPAVMRTLDLGVATRDLRAITQENILVKQNVEPIFNENNQVIGCLIVEKDISEIDSNSAKVPSSIGEGVYDTLVGSMVTKLDVHTYLNDGVIIFDRNGKVSSLNPVATSLYQKLGYKDDLLELSFENLVLDGTGITEILNSSVPKVSEVSLANMTLLVKYATMVMGALDQASIVVVIKDLTDERAIEKELILKSVAMREIHHRVKNNLQTIASLLRLQSRRIDNEDIKKSFEESISRIISIAVTHEILAQNGIDDVDIKTILSKISDNMVQISKKSNVIDIEILGDSLSVKSDIATSIALVVNELLQNSIQYAFTESYNGKIEIIIKKGEKYSNITVADNGIGFDPNSVRPGSLGMKIVDSIIKDKLKGCYTIESNSLGTRTNFDFYQH